MSTQPDETEARNVMTALNGIRRERGAKFEVESEELQQRAATDATTVEQVMSQLQGRDGVVVRDAGPQRWEVRRS